MSSLYDLKKEALSLRLRIDDLIDRVRVVNNSIDKLEEQERNKNQHKLFEND